MASRRFQKWAAKFPLTRRFVRSEGEAMFDLVAGFCHSQILQAFVRLEIHKKLLETEMTCAVLADECEVPPDRMAVLMGAAVSLGLVKQGKSGRYGLTTRGAALAGVPGLAGMIDHHEVLYLDLADPVAFFKGEVDTELAEFWPYVLGAGGLTDARATQTYSQLMEDCQVLVAEDTIDAVGLSDVRQFMDVGGGTGAFLSAVAKEYPHLELMLFDLPRVSGLAQERMERLGIANQVQIMSGSFHDDPLPRGADMISLVRVLYDHDDAAVLALLKSVREALPDGGRILISEPMTGGATPERAGNAYFALYCMAMRTGRARSTGEVAALLEQAGFTDIKVPRTRRPYITSVVTAVRQS
ncbi:MAG: methyltransferase [Pseudomonadota bacterium]